MGIFELPEGYSEIKRVNLQKDIKAAVIVNVLALIIAVITAFIGGIIVPFSFDNIVDGESINALLISMLKLFCILPAMVAYFFGHEFVHGIFIKKYSGRKAKYGFTGLYAYAGSDAYFNKRQYLMIALAPVVFFGIVFLGREKPHRRWVVVQFFCVACQRCGADSFDGRKCFGNV